MQGIRPSIIKITLALIFSAAVIVSPQQNDVSSKENILPKNTLGEIINSFISVINSSDKDSVSIFVNKYLSKDLGPVAGKIWSGEKYLSLLQNLRQDAGLISPVDVSKSNDENYLVVIFKTTKSEKPVGIEFKKNINDNTLRSLEVHVLGMPNKPYQWPGEKLDEKGIADAINEKLQKDFNAGAFSGNVLIARGDKIILEKSYGYANIEKQILNNNKTRFHTGSLGKMITATAIAQLVERGKLKFSDTLGTILKDYPNSEAAKGITIHELLTHTSGVADPFELGRRKPGVDYSTPKSNLPLFADAELTMKPGSHHSYSNGNYAVLAAIVEQVSGMTFENYINENIFKPAGMQIGNQQEYKNLPIATRYSNSAENDPLALRPVTPVVDLENDIQFEYSGYSNGYLTADDVYRFLYSLRENKLVSKEMVDMITTGKVSIEEGAPFKYGYGFYDANMWGVNLRGHSGGGGNSGIGADAEMLWNNNYYVIVLGNCDLEKVRPISFSIVRFLGNQ